MNGVRGFFTRHRTVSVAVLAGALFVAGGTGAVLLALGGPKEPAPTAKSITVHDAARTLVAQGIPLQDTDNDGLADILENYAYGSDPHDWDTTQSGVPDGWLARHGFVPTEARVGNRLAQLPPPEAIPKAYEGEWPGSWHLTLAHVYAWNRSASWNESVDGPFDNRLDPNRWDNSGTGIPDGWLLAHGLDPLQAGVAALRLAGDELTVLENFHAGTNPRLRDTDGDGLADATELRVYGTDPRRPDTSRAGIPDGWLVRFNLPTSDPSIAHQDPAGKGLTLGDNYAYNVARFGASAALAGQGLDPTRPSTRDGKIPDGWYVRYGLDPLQEDAEEKPRWRASDWTLARHLDAGIGEEGALGDVAWTYWEKYAHGRPAAWDEAKNGPWWGGLRPDTNDTDEDGVPDINESHGWYVERRASIVPNEAPEIVRVSSNPLGNDTDGDGLSDKEEYSGSAARNGKAYAFQPSDPSNRDTAFSGLTDAEKAFGPVREGIRYDFSGTRFAFNTTRADSNGTLVRDGAAVDYWHNRYLRYSQGDGYEYPDSQFETIEDWLSLNDQVQPSGSGREALALLFRPDGDLDGDGVPNAFDPDADGDTLLNGAELDPLLFALRGPFSRPEEVGPFPRPGTDPGNSETDGDGLRDDWEVKFADWRPDAQAWNLDPTKYSSMPDGRSDAEQNLDADFVAWWKYAAAGSGFDEEAQEFDFNNLREFQAATNPNVRDQDFDGVPEGWRVFWGVDYPAVFQQQPATLGALRPTALPQDRVAAIKAIAAGPLNDLALSSSAYLRFVEAPTASAASLFPPLSHGEDVEIIQDPNGNPIPVLRNGNRELRYLAKITGTYVLDAPAASQLGTNPYLPDTDGDGLEDAWEAFHGCTNPTRHDQGADPDHDGILNVQERALGTSPCLGDTDAGGLADGDEIALGLDPRDPTDDATVLDSDEDTDGDGIADSVEILFRKLSPFSPDTDKDGLLDGSGPDGGDLILYAPGEAARISKLLPHGVAHQISRVPANGSLKYTFLSETTNGANPRDPDTSRTGLPDGWLQYYQFNPASVPSDPVLRNSLRDAYAWGKPAWWAESVHGVWWWGRNPRLAGQDLQDLDRDGLDDRNGEDLVPFASHNNTILDAAQTLFDAQARGDCAGNPAPCRLAAEALDYDGDGTPDRLDRVPVSIVVQPAPSLVTKGVPFVLTGQMTINCSTPAFTCAGAPQAPRNRPVFVSLTGPKAAILGVNLTRADGRFTVEACLCGPRTVQLAEAVPVLGSTTGSVGLDPEPATIPLGPGHRLRVWTYNTTATLYGAHDASRDALHPQRAGVLAADGRTTNATQWAAVTLDATFTLRAESRIVPNLQNAVVDRGQRLVGSVRLEDSAGLPQTGTVHIVWAGAVPVATTTVTTDPEGGAAPFDLLASPSAPGQYPLTFQFAGAGHLTGNSTTVQVPVRFDSMLTAQFGEPSNRTASGESVRVGGELRSSAGPAPNQVVRASLGGAFLGEALTQSNGAFQIVTSTVPPLEPGHYAIDLAFGGSQLLRSSRVELPVTIVERTRLALTDPPTEWPVGRHLVLRGVLHGADGSGIQGATIHLAVEDQPSIATQTGADGAFEFQIAWIPALPVGTRGLAVSFPGTGLLGPAQNQTSVLIATATQIVLPPGSVAQAQEGFVAGLLRRSDGVPLPGRPVEVTWAGNTLGSAITDGVGAFSRPIPASRTAALGTYAVEARYNETGSQLFLPSQAQTSYHVKAGSRLLLDLADSDRAAFSLTGALRTAVGEGVRGAAVDVEISGHAARVTTGSDGRFIHTFPRLNASVGTNQWTARYAGNETLAPSNGSAVALVRSTTQLIVVGPATSAASQPIELSVRLLEDDGRDAAPAGTLRASLDGEALSSVPLATNPARLPLVVPAEVPAGRLVVRIDYEGDGFLRDSFAQHPLEIREEARLQIETPPGMPERGATVPVLVRLVGSAGEALSGQEVGVATNAYRLPFTVTTDENGEGRVDVPVPDEGALVVEARYLGSSTHVAANAEAVVPAAAGPGAGPSFDLLGAVLILVSAILAAGTVLSIGAVTAWARPRGIAIRALDEAIRVLEADGPYAAAVLLAYRRLRGYLGRFGFAERPGETAREFVAALSRRLAVEPAHAATLVGLFERARYASGQHMGPDDRRRAHEALRHIRAAIDEAVRSPRSSEVPA